jgi:hypothetical protein
MVMPDETARAAILRTMTRQMRLEGDFDFQVGIPIIIPEIIFIL